MPAQPEVLCVTCRHFSPALEPSLRQALFGFCAKWEWPFTLTLTEGVTECELYERAAHPVAMAAETGAGERAAAAKARGQRRVEFYYSTREKPGEQYPCNIENALRLLRELEARGVACKAVDVGGQNQDLFPVYHRAVTGPAAEKRAVFGTKGALEEDFGRRAPALLIFEGDRYPSEVFPRMDQVLNKLVGVEEALQMLAERAQAPGA